MVAEIWARRVFRPAIACPIRLFAGSPHRPFGYPRVAHSQHAPALASLGDRVMLVVSWKNNLELIVANS
jgi:hypothetical protein